MKKLLVRIIKKIKKSFTKQNKIFQNRSQKISQLREQKKSDVERWECNEQLFEDWNERTKILGDYIHSHSRIIEFGAGNMFLKDYLKNYEIYTPSDVVKRFEETVVCDLNETLTINLLDYNTVVFSGVLEYVYDVDKVFAQFNTEIKQIVMSYCCSDIVKLTREKNGWLSDYTYAQLVQIFEKYNYKIEDYKEWRQQSIFNLIKKP
ncbi:hypothetical protein [Flavobacterium anhuiense]|uniref:hypothetical protein n=1 Tax=Flavobacterium anhuiense TaxID=459526 RepID=UPI003D974560